MSQFPCWIFFFDYRKITFFAVKAIRKWQRLLPCLILFSLKIQKPSKNRKKKIEVLVDWTSHSSFKYYYKPTFYFSSFQIENQQSQKYVKTHQEKYLETHEFFTINEIHLHYNKVGISIRNVWAEQRNTEAS